MLILSTIYCSDFALNLLFCIHLIHSNVSFFAQGYKITSDQFFSSQRDIAAPGPDKNN